MLSYHQCGHNFVWNVQSLEQDHVGAGLIISPMNVAAENLQDRVPGRLLSSSWFDPQFYLPNDSKGQLASYPFFPANVMGEFVTTEFEEHADSVAMQCLEYQLSLSFRYSVIPVRYPGNFTSDYYAEQNDLFVEPFIRAATHVADSRPLLLTVIAKESLLASDEATDELLSWATSYTETSGVYLIVENSAQSKQIKDAGHLTAVMRFIRILRENGLEVHLGYTGLEGLLYSIADPTSVSLGSYENLRSFDIRRHETTEKGQRQGPRPRIYSPVLLQSIVDTSLPPLKQLYPQWESLFGDSRYKDYLLNRNLNFQRPEIYKHYFYEYDRQIASLPDNPSERFHWLASQVDTALARFVEIQDARVFLDPDSDGSHLVSWRNAMSMYDSTL